MKTLIGSLRIGSRGSRLALWQSEFVAARLRENAHDVSIQIIRTTGDRITDVALAKVGTKGMFTKEIEEALAAGEVDLAVHSLKDLPTTLLPGFELAAILEREHVEDAFVSVRFANLAELPQGAHVGTSSLRRQAQLLRHRSDLRVSPLRGNVDSRIKKLETGEFDAIILASAGLQRLGLTQHLREVLSPEIMCPAAGQGALAIEIRQGDTKTRQAVAFLDDDSARATTLCERTALNALGGGCQVPIGASASMVNGRLSLRAVVAHPDGSSIITEQLSGHDPVELGQRTGQALLARGAQKILDDVYRSGVITPELP